MPEFLEHYIIIRQEGSILVVETISELPITKVTGFH